MIQCMKMNEVKKRYKKKKKKKEKIQKKKQAIRNPNIVKI